MKVHKSLTLAKIASRIEKLEVKHSEEMTTGREEAATEVLKAWESRLRAAEESVTKVKDQYDAVAAVVVVLEAHALPSEEQMDAAGGTRTSRYGYSSSHAKWNTKDPKGHLAAIKQLTEFAALLDLASGDIVDLPKTTVNEIMAKGVLRALVA